MFSAEQRRLSRFYCDLDSVLECLEKNGQQAGSQICAH